jgi:SAM-dependent methyltransferase
VSYIEFAPNHVHAFPRWAYDKVGGYDPSRAVLEDQDLMCRLYQEGPFVLVDECLYLQRMHPGQTQRRPGIIARDRQETVVLYDRYAESHALAWSARKGLVALDLLGPGRIKRRGYKRGSDITADVAEGIDLPDSSVGVIRALDCFGQVTDMVAFMNECHRLLAHGGMLLTFTPSIDGRAAFQDQAHLWFWPYTNGDYARDVPEISCRFLLSRIGSYVPSPLYELNPIVPDWHEPSQIVRKPGVPYVYANLVALKDGGRQGGLM